MQQNPKHPHCGSAHREAYYQITPFHIVFEALAAACLLSGDAWAGEPLEPTQRMQDAEDPYRTTPLPAAQAKGVEKVEAKIAQIERDQEGLKAGQLKQAEYDKAVAEAKREVATVAASLPHSAPVQTSAARAYIQAGDYGQAIDHASWAIGLAPRDPFPVTTRGMAYYSSGDFPRAAADARRALTLDPGNAVAKAIYELSMDRVPGDGGLGLKSALSRAGRELASLPPNPYLAGTERGEPAAGGGPGDEPAGAGYARGGARRFERRISAAESAMRRRDFLSAFGHANEALAMYSGDNPRAHAVRAVSAWNLGDFRTAVADASKVLASLSEGHSAQHPMLVARAAASSELGRYADALRDARTATSLFPRSGRAHLERAIAREGLREAPAEVVADYKRAAELDPQFTPDYERALARLTPEAQGRAVASAAEAARSPFLGSLAARYGIQMSGSDARLALGVLAAVGLFSIAAFGLVRRS